MSLSRLRYTAIYNYAGKLQGVIMFGIVQSRVDNIQHLHYNIIRGELIMVYRMLEYFLRITLILHCHGGMLHYAWPGHACSISYSQIN